MSYAVLLLSMNKTNICTNNIFATNLKLISWNKKTIRFYVIIKNWWSFLLYYVFGESLKMSKKTYTLNWSIWTAISSMESYISNWQYSYHNTSGQGTFAAAHLKALTQPFAEFLINYKLGITRWHKSHQVHATN